ncbi:MAG TPA: peptide chain release factor N(5)-glutamine methyltransferase [Anaerolineales bacterium]|nr:peptide chain release factor N(5)-glutamine methyltransferase [Anaerolineales bacterium]HNN13678.1 peptide chain release factor N(5)-glutamine methyltransferase [Anaerolineales bacterium]HNO30380.1 peptide chain release factor N(5)-glutamine methyltransferase [Anaerolineales bacterium]
MNAGEYLASKEISCEKLNAQVLLAHVMGSPRSWLLAHLDAPLTPSQLDSAEQAFARLEAGEPLPYILGHWEFFGLDFNMTSDVLIPRPETEQLVQQALKWLSANPKKRSVADIGTGSGIIAVSIAKHCPDAQILGTDISAAALQVARANAEKYGVSHQIEFMECDLLPNTGSARSFDLLCANLPYIPTETMRGLPIHGREPTLALDGGPDGLDVYRKLLTIVSGWASTQTLLLLEIEASQGESSLGLGRSLFPNSTLQIYQDLSGHDRLLEIWFNG